VWIDRKTLLEQDPYVDRFVNAFGGDMVVY
jgi:hypothetical protein